MAPDELFAYVNERWGTTPEFMWARWPNYGVLRHAPVKGKAGKWYGVSMDVPACKLTDFDAEAAGVTPEEKVNILNVKCDPEAALVLRLSDDIMPAYHMNKRNWISIRIDGAIPDDLICQLLEMSWNLTK